MLRPATCRPWIETGRYGMLYVDKVIFSDNNPILFTRINEIGDIFLCTLSERNEQNIKWLIGKTEPNIIIRMLQNRIDIREAMLMSSDKLVINYENKKYVIDYASPDWNPESPYLPKPDSYLYPEPGEFDKQISYFEYLRERNEKNMQVNTYDELKYALFDKLISLENILKLDDKDYELGDIRKEHNALYDFVKECELIGEYYAYKENPRHPHESWADYLSKQQKVHPEADEKVLRFIYDIFHCHGSDSSNLEHLRLTFRAGYCYYFAVILNTAFGMGREDVYLTAPYGHFVWIDPKNKIPYDVEGVYDGECECFIPEHELRKNGMINDFLHVSEKSYGAKKDEIEKLMRKYTENKQ